MVQKIKLVSKQVVLSVTALAMVFGLSVLIAPPANAAPVNCHVFNATSAGYEGGAHRTKQYEVPGVAISGCKDINIRNVSKSTVNGKYCATFYVQFFPTSGGDYYNNPTKVCSQDPDGSGPKDGPVIPIATNVINGTKYRVWHKIEELGQPARSFQIVD